MSLFDVIIGENCDCHDMFYCHHGPLINMVVEADSKDRIESMLPEQVFRRYDVWIKEQQAKTIDDLLNEVNEELDI